MLNFQDGQRVLVNKVVYEFHEPERGDVIVFAPPEFHNQKVTPFIKRIIGLPGESVEIKEGTLYIHTKNSKIMPLDEPYIAEKSTSFFKGGVIPKNEYFVLGDNRKNSSDSRRGWTVPRQNITGKTWLTIWPPGKWGLAANYSLQEQINNLMSE